jgi:hypothetical protein
MAAGDAEIEKPVQVLVFLCLKFGSCVHGKTSQYTKQVMTGLPKAFATAPS